MALKEEVARRAEAEAHSILEEAQDRADAMRREAEDYVDAKLAQFEIALRKILEDTQIVCSERGRRPWTRSRWGASSSRAGDRRRCRRSRPTPSSGPRRSCTTSTRRRMKRGGCDAGRDRRSRSRSATPGCVARAASRRDGRGPRDRAGAGAGRCPIARRPAAGVGGGGHPRFGQRRRSLDRSGAPAASPSSISRSSLDLDELFVRHPDEDSDAYPLGSRGTARARADDPRRDRGRDARSPRSVAPIAKGSARRVAVTATSGSARATPSSISGSRCSPTSSPICPTSTDDEREGITHRWPSPRRSRARRGPRSARATWKGEAPTYSACPQCKQPKLPHRVCANCGYYAGRQAVEVE